MDKSINLTELRYWPNTGRIQYRYCDAHDTYFDHDTYVDDMSIFNVPMQRMYCRSVSFSLTE